MKVTKFFKGKQAILKDTYGFVTLETGVSFMVFPLAGPADKVFAFFLITGFQFRELQRGGNSVYTISTTHVPQPLYNIIDRV